MVAGDLGSECGWQASNKDKVKKKRKGGKKKERSSTLVGGMFLRRSANRQGKWLGSRPGKKSLTAWRVLHRCPGERKKNSRPGEKREVGWGIPV